MSTKITIVVQYFMLVVFLKQLKLRWTPEIVHCHGWMSALSPLYIKNHTKTNHRLEIQKLFSLYMMTNLILHSQEFKERLMLKGR